MTILNAACKNKDLWKTPIPAGLRGICRNGQSEREGTDHDCNARWHSDILLPRGARYEKVHSTLSG
jgi:hypothetical protein